MLRNGSLFLFSALACHHTETPKSEAALPLTASAAVVSSPTPAPGEGSSAAPASPSASPGTAASASSPSPKEELVAFVATRQACAQASDCTNVTGSCPFGCTIPVAKSAESDVKQKLAELVRRQEEQGPRCVYRCAAPVPPVCVSGRCSLP